MDTVSPRSSINPTAVYPAAAYPIVAHRGWLAAEADLLGALRAGPGLVALLGSPGTGKSLLLRHVARALQADGMEITSLSRGDATHDAELHGAELHGIVLIDEADRMAPGALAALCARDDVTAILAALPGFAGRLPDLPGIRTVALAPLDAGEAAGFVAARLAQGGHPPDLVEPAAVAALLHRADGIPRVLHALLRLAIFAASLEGASRVTPAHVAEAVSFRDGGDAPPPSPLPTSLPALPVGSARGMNPVAMPDAQPAPPAPRRGRWGAWAIAAAALLCLGGAAALLPPATIPAHPGAPAGVAVASLADDTLPTQPAVPAAAPIPSPTLQAPVADAAPLPSGSLVRVVLSYPMGNADAARRSADLARRLRDDGVTIGAPVPVLPPITVSALLYYFAQDRDDAAEIGRKLDGRFGEPMLARLPPRAPLPRPGTIELVLTAAGP